MALNLVTHNDYPHDGTGRFWTERDTRALNYPRPQALWPAYQYQSFVDYGAAFISVPIGLLAVICLAWPVTSFILAQRRRKGRGFEVQTAVGGQKPEVSQMSEAPKVRQEREPGASPRVGGGRDP